MLQVCAQICQTYNRIGNPRISGLDSQYPVVTDLPNCLVTLSNKGFGRTTMTEYRPCPLVVQGYISSGSRRHNVTVAAPDVLAKDRLGLEHADMMIFSMALR
jgi:hypothetical protein